MAGTGTAVRAGDVRRPAMWGSAGVVTSAVLVLVLDVRTWGWPLHPDTRTISSYVFEGLRWPFYLAVLLLAAGSAGILVAAVRAGLTRWTSTASGAVLVWCVGLVLVVLFDKHDWTVGPSTSGYVHQAACLSAFATAPAAGLLVASRHRRDGGARARRARALWRLSAATALWFAAVVATVVLRVVADVPLVPLGVMERVLAAGEVSVVLGIGRIALTSSTYVDGSRVASGSTAA